VASKVSDPKGIESDEGRDQRLAQLVAGLADQLRRGEQPDIDAVAQKHADLAKDIRELWAAIQMAEVLAHPCNELNATVDLPSERPPREPNHPAAALLRTVGDYELLEEVGRGAMGVVYKARQRSLDRRVAIKMLLRGELASGVDLARFRTEAESAGRLEHPNVVKIFEVGECDGQAYFSMQYIEGTTLARLVANGPLPPRDAARYLAPICRAIHHAHQEGILHRDLKPSNVLINQGGVPHVSDFGLAKRVQDSAPASEFGTRPRGLTQTGAIVGTPSYMPPEQAAGSRGVLGPASDIYSLGAILYELLTGRPPFQAATHLDTLWLVLEQDVVPPRLLNRQVDRALEMICLKCLQKPPRLRYETAAQLADDLEAFLRGEPPTAASSSLVYHVVRLLGETHQANVLENWGLLWMWHSLALIVLCSVTNWLYLMQVDTPLPYLGLWVVGLGTWASIFWMLRRRGGPVTFVERQIAHIWAASTIGSASLFGVEYLLKLPMLRLSPVLAILGGMVFLIKGGMLSGFFYLAAAACFVTAVFMAWFPKFGVLLFGLVSAACFFFPGLKYYRQHVRSASQPRTGEPVVSAAGDDPPSPGNCNRL
jgi:serine/threonine-protein kinase